MTVVLWRGWGLLVVAYFVIAELAPALLVNRLLGPGTYSLSNFWDGVSFTLAGVASILTGLYLNRRHGAVPYTRQPPDRPFAPRWPFFYARHNLFFIPMEAWGVFMLALGVLFFVASVVLPHRLLGS